MVRTFSFQHKDMLNKLLMGADPRNPLDKACQLSRDKLNSLAQVVGIEIAEGLNCVYHWVALEYEHPVTEAHLTRSFLQLINFYGFDECVLLELEIPEEELIILGNPEDRQVTVSPLKSRYEHSNIEGVTSSLNLDWLVAYHEFTLIKQTGEVRFNTTKMEHRKSHLTPDLAFNIYRPDLTHPHDDIEYFNVEVCDDGTIIGSHYGKGVAVISYEESDDLTSMSYLTSNKNFTSSSYLCLLFEKHISINQHKTIRFKLNRYSELIPFLVGQGFVLVSLAHRFYILERRNLIAI